MDTWEGKPLRSEPLLHLRDLIPFANPTLVHPTLRNGDISLPKADPETPHRGLF
jgi:hypothetical protein